MNNQNNIGAPVAPARSRRGLWVIVGVVIVLAVGFGVGLFLFRNVFRPGQQQRVIEMAPFMAAFLDRPDPNATVPTVQPPANGELSAADLLSENFNFATAESTASATTVATAETTLQAAFAVTPTPAAPDLMASLFGIGVAYAQDTTEAPATAIANAQPVLVPPSSARLYGFTHVQQTWNNCGPANITMALSYFGWKQDQTFAANWLKPDPEDKNVSPNEMVSFVNENSGVRAITRIGGSVDLIKKLLANNFPVLIETGYAPEGYDWIGHYRTIVAYDDTLGNFYIYDSYLGFGTNDAGMTESYSEFDRNWQAFNRVFIVLYDKSREAELTSLLGDMADVNKASEHALTVAQSEARQNPTNVYPWFNMGTALTKLKRYDEAAVAYDKALQLGLHFRMLWYQFGPFEAYFNTRRYNDVLALVNNNLTNGGSYVEETYYWQGMVFAAEGQKAQAASAFHSALVHNAHDTEAQDALNSLGA
jgi:hypothetical protein